MYKNMNKNKRNNSLSEHQYIISPQLHELLERGTTNDNKFLDKKSDGLYLVMFRVLNKDSNVLICNYICYNLLFLQCLIFFFMVRVEFSTDMGLNEGNDYLIHLDYEFLKDEDRKKNKLFLNVSNKYYKDLLDYIASSDFTIEGILYRVNKLILISSSEEMSAIIESAYKKEYVRFINKVLSNKEGNNLLEESSQDSLMQEETPINMINGNLFVVKNIKLLIDNIKKKGYIVNGGPQAWRDQINSISSFLSCLDYDFRNSLYNHNRYHVHHENIESKLLLDKNKFSFNNIHMNLGKVRWYSTKINKSGDLSSCREICLDCLDTLNWFYLNKGGFIISTNSLSLPNILEDKVGIYVYQLISDKNNIFIGLAYNVPERLVEHRYCINNDINACPQFYDSVKKYGWDNFRLGILEYIDLPRKVIINKIAIRKFLLDREEFYLNKMSPILNINKLPISLIRRKQIKEMRKFIKALSKKKR